MASLSTHFPNASKSYKIATDGDCLIIKNVEIQNKLYDLKIWRKDASNQPIELTDKSEFHQGTIVRVAELAANLFGQIDPNALMHTKVSYSNAPVSCRTEDLLKVGEARFTSQESNQPFVNCAAKIHSIFFSEESVSLVDKEEIISPYFEIPSDFLEGLKPQYKEEPRSSLASNKIKEKTVLRTEEKEEAKPVPEARKKSSSTPTSSKQKTKKTNLKKQPASNVMPISNAWEQIKGPGGISYRQLQNYSLTEKSEKDPLYAPYQKFLDELENPGSDKDMYGWLQKLYEKAYQVNKTLTNQYENEKLSFEGNFDDWCKDRAAKAVAEFIQSDTSSDDLIEALKENTLSA